MDLKIKAGLVLLVMGLVVAPVMAADAPRYEIFGGFTHLDSELASFNGFGASVTANWNDWFSVVNDFSGHFSDSPDITRWYFLSGPQFNARTGKFNIFGRALFGAAQTRFDSLPLAGARFSQFAMGLGVGLDVHLAKHFGLRLIQADWIRQFGDGSGDEWDLRLGAGVLVTF